MPKRAGFIFNMLIFILGASGACLFILFLPPFETSRSLVNHLARDGSLEMFSQGFYHTLRIPGLLACGLILAALGYGLMNRLRTLAWIDRAFLFLKELRLRCLREIKEILQGFCALRITRWERATLVCLVCLAVLPRVAFLMAPLYHDEAYTVVTFAGAPLNEALSDYHHPNNHIFHTLLVHLALKLYDPVRMIAPPWVVRFPAFLAGVLLVLLVYFFTRRLYGSQAAFIAGCAAAGMPAMISFSVIARGYSLMMFFTLLILVIADYVRRRRNIIGWGLLVLFSALGFYTIPIFICSYGVMLAWFLLSLWARREHEEYRSPWELLKWLVISGIATALLTTLLYMPVILRYHGPGIILHPTSEAVAWAELFDVILSRFSDIVQEWLFDLPPFMGYLAGVGLALAIILPSENGRYANPFKETAGKRFSPQLLILATTAAMAGLIVVLRPNLYPRFVSFLIPLIIIWVSAGWFLLIQLIERALHSPGVLTWAIAILVFVGVAVGSGLRIASYAARGYYQTGNDELVVQFLKQNLRESDLVVVSPPHDAVIWYYSRLHGIDMDHYKRELPFFRAFVLVDPGVQETLESVLVDRGPELFFFDLSQAKVVFQSGSSILYECVPDLDLIRKEYRLK